MGKQHFGRKKSTDTTPICGRICRRQDHFDRDHASKIGIEAKMSDTTINLKNYWQMSESRILCFMLVVFFFLWYSKLRGLFNAKPIPVEEQ